MTTRIDNANVVVHVTDIVWHQDAPVLPMIAKIDLWADSCPVFLPTGDMPELTNEQHEAFTSWVVGQMHTLFPGVLDDCSAMRWTAY